MLTNGETMYVPRSLSRSLKLANWLIGNLLRIRYLQLRGCIRLMLALPSWYSRHKAMAQYPEDEKDCKAVNG